MCKIFAAVALWYSVMVETIKEQMNFIFQFRYEATAKSGAAQYKKCKIPYCEKIPIDTNTLNIYFDISSMPQAMTVPSDNILLKNV